MKNKKNNKFWLTVLSTSVIMSLFQVSSFAMDPKSKRENKFGENLTNNSGINSNKELEYGLPRIYFDSTDSKGIPYYIDYENKKLVLVAYVKDEDLVNKIEMIKQESIEINGDEYRLVFLFFGDKKDVDTKILLNLYTKNEIFSEVKETDITDKLDQNTKFLQEFSNEKKISVFFAYEDPILDLELEDPILDLKLDDSIRAEMKKIDEMYNLDQGIKFLQEFPTQEFPTQELATQEFANQEFTNNEEKNIDYFTYVEKKSADQESLRDDLFEYKLDTETKTAKILRCLDKNIESAHIADFANYVDDAYKITEIGENAFEGCNELKDIWIGKFVNKIGAGAFGSENHKIIIQEPEAMIEVAKDSLDNCKIYALGKNIVLYSSDENGNVSKGLIDGYTLIFMQHN